MRRTMVGVVTALALVVALAGCSSSDDEASDDEDPSTTTTEVATDDEARAFTEAARLVDSLDGDQLAEVLTTSGIDVDIDEVETCFARGMLAEPDLLELDFDALEPTDPEGAQLMGIFFGCLPEGAVVEMMVAAVEGEGAPPDAVACVRTELEALPQAEAMDLFLAAAADDTTALEEVLAPCAPA